MNGVNGDVNANKSRPLRESYKQQGRIRGVDVDYTCQLSTGIARFCNFCRPAYAYRSGQRSSPVAFNCLSNGGQLTNTATENHLQNSF